MSDRHPRLMLFVVLLLLSLSAVQWPALAAAPETAPASQP